MRHNVWIYIAIMAAATYAIRVLPLTLIRRPIKSTLIRSFLYYVPYVTLAVMTFPAILDATQSVWAAVAALVVDAALRGGVCGEDAALLRENEGAVVGVEVVEADAVEAEAREAVGDARGLVVGGEVGGAGEVRSEEHTS